MQPCPQSREQQKRSLAAEVLRSTGRLQLAALGNSMLPTLWPRDLVTIHSQPFDRLQVGDVVLFVREEQFFIHRILSKSETERRVVTRGDAMPTADAPISTEELLGKVVSVRRRDQDIAVPVCSRLHRWAGLVSAYSDRLRSVALRLHAMRSRTAEVNSEFAPREIPLR